jgi:hypothetical protein
MVVHSNGYPYFEILVALDPASLCAGAVVNKWYCPKKYIFQ